MRWTLVLHLPTLTVVYRGKPCMLPLVHVTALLLRSRYISSPTACTLFIVAQPPPLVRPATHVYKKKCAGRLYCAEPAFTGLHHVPVLNCGRPTCETSVCFPLALCADHIANVDLYCGHAQHFQRLCCRPPVGFAKLPSCARACADSLAVTNSWQCWFQAKIYGQLT